MSCEKEHGSGVYLAGARAALPFALATFVLGISFGVLARSLGWGIVAPIVFSVIAFSGSAQFAVVAVLGAGGGALAAIVAAILLNSRFLPMGVAVAPFLKGGPLRRALEGQAVIDASWALASRGGGRFDREFMMGATAPQVAAWIGGTLIGVLASDVVGDAERLGLDAIFPAFFVALLADELRGGGLTIAAALIVTTLWVAILGVAVASAAIKAVGPVRVGGKELPPGAGAVIALLAPALLTALVVTETFGEDGHLVLDARAVGVGVAALALALRAPVLLAVALAALTTALLRALG